MGGVTSAAIYLRSRDRVELIDAVATIAKADGLQPLTGDDLDVPPEGARRYLLLPAREGWTPLMPERLKGVRELASEVAGTAGCAALALLMVDDGFAFAYEAFDSKGSLVDAYHSCPDAEKGFDEDDASASELKRTRGNPSKLASLGVPADRLEGVAEVLADARIERLRDHNVSAAKYDDAEEPCRLFREALGLGDHVIEGFDALWDLGLDEASETELRHLAYGPPPKPSGFRRFMNAMTTSDKDEPLDDEDELDDDEPIDDDEDLD